MRACQCRYVRYFARLIRERFVYTPKPVVLVAVEISECPVVNGFLCSMSLFVSNDTKRTNWIDNNKLIFSKQPFFESRFNKDLGLRSSRVVDTLSHISTPIFSVGCRFFSLFPCHTNGLQVLALWYQSSFSSVFLVCAWRGGPCANTRLASVFYRLPCVVHDPAISVFSPWRRKKKIIKISNYRKCLHIHVRRSLSRF